MGKKISVLFLLPHLDLGGGARRIKVYCDYLDQKKFTPFVAIYSHQVKRDIKNIVGEKTSYLITEDLDEIKKYIEKNKIDLIYTFYDGQYQPFLFELLSFCRTKKIKLIANNVFAYYDKQMDELFDLVVFQTYMMLVIKFYANYLSSNSKIDYRRYRILHNPVNTEYFEKFRLHQNEKKQLKESLGFKGSDFIVGRFGRNDIVKWGDILLSAIWKLRKDDEIKFLLVGVPKSRKILFRIFNYFYKNKLVVLDPKSDDKWLMNLMQISDLIGHGVNIGEGCSNAINEEMFWGKPVVTNSTPHCDNGQVEQVEHLKTGIIANDGSAFAKAILKLKDDKKLSLKLGQSARKKAVSLYGAKKVVQELEQIIISLVEGSENYQPNYMQKFNNYRKEYFKNLKTFLKPATQTTTQKVSRLIVRVLNYGEYKIYNG